MVRYGSRRWRRPRCPPRCLPSRPPAGCGRSTPAPMSTAWGRCSTRPSGARHHSVATRRSTPSSTSSSEPLPRQRSRHLTGRRADRRDKRLVCRWHRPARPAPPCRRVSPPRDRRDDGHRPHPLPGQSRDGGILPAGPCRPRPVGSPERVVGNPRHAAPRCRHGRGRLRLSPVAAGTGVAAGSWLAAALVLPT